MTELEHGRGSGEPETPLTPPETKAPSHAERARTLVGLQKTGTLCTVARDPEGYPYGSFVTFALDGPDPVFLVSTLAAHTKNLMGDGRASASCSCCRTKSWRPIRSYERSGKPSGAWWRQWRIASRRGNATPSGSASR